MNTAQLLPALRDLYSRLPEMYFRQPWELQHVLYSLNYTDDLDGEADARGLDHLAYTALGLWPELKEAYSELKSIPSPEVRGRRIENVPKAFSMPSMKRVRPTPEQYRTAGCREGRAHLRKASGRLGDRFVVGARAGRFTCVASAALPASTIVTTSGMVPGRSTRRRV